MKDQEKKKYPDFAINYIEDDGVFVGFFVNYSNIIAQRNSLKELEEALMVSLKIVLNRELEKAAKEDCWVKMISMSDKQWKETYKQ
jgi:predicted RNase H-like HicB family nuclease